MEPEQQFIDGFNRGYLIAKHEPELSAKLATIQNNHSPFFQGIIAGKEQYEMEVQEWAKGFGRGGVAKDQREQDLER